jgi:hypothetical protein
MNELVIKDLEDRLKVPNYGDDTYKIVDELRRHLIARTFLREIMNSSK